MQPDTSAASRSSQIASAGKNAPEPVRHSEGKIARTIEDQTARLPSDSFLWAAVAAIGVAMALQATGKKQDGLFVGQWVAPFLLFGVYNKIVKVAGSDRLSR
jgi:hypothetical protein